MISGEFGTIAIADVIVVERLRVKPRSAADFHRIRTSIARSGLMHPIIIDRNHVLVAGEGRVIICRELGWTHIPFQYVDEIDYKTRRRLELEENNARQDLEWEDQHNGYIELIKMFREEKPNITLDELGLELNLTGASISRHLLYEETKDNAAVKAAAKSNGLQAAVNVAVRVRERERYDTTISCVLTSRKDTPLSPIITTDFNLWAPTYKGPRFNLIHCDFPYGIDAHEHAGQSRSYMPEYVDTQGVNAQLFRTLEIHLDRLCAPQAHMFFWFSPSLIPETRAALGRLEGFVWEPHPLIWQRGENEGIAPDPARRPRRVYEMAFFGWRNDRKIIRTKANSIVAPTERQRHPHEKSERALRHFFEMCVDANTSLLDPTCGSGSALRAARALGAGHILGLESNPDYANEARISLEKSANDM